VTQRAEVDVRFTPKAICLLRDGEFDGDAPDADERYQTSMPPQLASAATRSIG
jgi:hypothetical protein